MKMATEIRIVNTLHNESSAAVQNTLDDAPTKQTALISSACARAFAATAVHRSTSYSTKRPLRHPPSTSRELGANRTPNVVVDHSSAPPSSPACMVTTRHAVSSSMRVTTWRGLVARARARVFWSIASFWCLEQRATQYAYGGQDETRKRGATVRVPFVRGPI